jgi:hypothetical protein
VQRLDAGPGDEGPDGREIGDIERCGCDAGVAGGCGDLGGDPVPCVQSADTEDDVGACCRQSTRGFDPDAGGRTGDDGAPAGQVDAGKDVSSR